MNDREDNKKCVVCDKTTKVRVKCGRCCVTFYCGTECQRKHWQNGHKENYQAPPKYSEQCLVCSEQTKLRCGKCNKAAYCSTGCQKLHWHKKHKIECKGSKILESKDTLFNYLNKKVAKDIDYKIDTSSSSSSAPNLIPKRYFNNINELEQTNLPLPPHLQNMQELLTKCETNDQNDIIDSDADYELEEQTDLVSLQHLEEELSVINDDNTNPILCGDNNHILLELSRHNERNCISPNCNVKSRAKKRTDQELKEFVYEQPLMELQVSFLEFVI